MESIDYNVLQNDFRVSKGLTTETDCDENDVCKCHGRFHQPHPEVLRATSGSLETKRTFL